MYSQEVYFTSRANLGNFQEKVYNYRNTTLQ